MHSPRRWPVGIFCLALGVCGAEPASGASITLTALVSDRGIDTGPRDGTFDMVFGNPSVVQILTPPIGDTGSEERTAIEFSLASLVPDTVVNSAVLQLSPQGNSANLGLGANETGEVHGYTGDGGVDVTDLMMFNLVGLIAGPTPDGPVDILIAPEFLQALVVANSPWAGFMFKGVDGPSLVSFAFAGTSGGIPASQRPQLTLDYTVVPEPTSLLLVSSGLAALAARARRRRRESPARGVS